jgi:hypothetical protein
MLSTMSVKMGIQADVVPYGSVISSCERGEVARVWLGPSGTQWNFELERSSMIMA